MEDEDDRNAQTDAGLTRKKSRRRSIFKIVKSMNIKLKLLIVFVILVHCVMVISRLVATGMAKHRLIRMHNVMIFSTAMLFTSVYMWRRVNFSLRHLLPTPSEVGNRRLRKICFQDVALAFFTLFIFLAHIAMMFFYVLLGSEPSFIALTSLSFLAAYLHILIFLLLADAILFTFYTIHEKVVTNSVYLYLHRNRSYHIFLAVLIGFMFMFGGLYATQTDPTVRRRDVQMKTFKSHSNTSIVLLSDIHIGPSVGRTRMQRIVEITNSLKPDIIAIAGDLADGMVNDFHEAAEPLCNLTAPGGVYFATGNHEYMHGNITEWFWFLERCNIKILHNSNKHVTIKNEKFCIAGADDLYAERVHIPGHGMNMSAALSTCNADSTNILLAHQPNAARIVIDDPVLSKKVNLILSGHTHGGQMYPWVPLVKIANAYLRGLYYDSRTDTYVYVSAGVNYFGPPIKMFKSCEIILLNLLSKN
ncbi:unnamed protein product [Caenorhabditis angaria]|uniref:Calcineurin-like phosphoesterase domain-containing protein n=1 Tax=Caenorhabditis angaria TaxID=860376 RepID=A0A9P1N9I8_9PELO|nr:unnamed protein product [Caenorhabditis angaria]